MDIEQIKPGMSNEDAAKAASEINRALGRDVPAATDGVLDIEDIKPGMSDETRKRALGDILKALKEG